MHHQRSMKNRLLCMEFLLKGISFACFQVLMTTLCLSWLPLKDSPSWLRMKLQSLLKRGFRVEFKFPAPRELPAVRSF